MLMSSQHTKCLMKVSGYKKIPFTFPSEDLNIYCCVLGGAISLKMFISQKFWLATWFLIKGGCDGNYRAGDRNRKGANLIKYSYMPNHRIQELGHNC